MLLSSTMKILLCSGSGLLSFLLGTCCSLSKWAIYRFNHLSVTAYVSLPSKLQHMSLLGLTSYSIIIPYVHFYFPWLNFEERKSEMGIKICLEMNIVVMFFKDPYWVYLHSKSISTILNYLFRMLFFWLCYPIYCFIYATFLL